MLLEKIIKLAKVIRDEKGRNAFLKWKPFSINCFFIARKLKEIGMPFKTIIDGGANTGQFARAVHEFFPESSIFSFEPLPDVLQLLAGNLGSVPRVKIIPIALGRNIGKIKFHKNDHSSNFLKKVFFYKESYQASSVLSFEEKYLKTAREAKTIMDIEVPITTLDKYFKREKLKKPVLLKLDLQGFEFEALCGGLKMLGNVQAVLLETSFKRIYEGEVLFPEIADLLKTKGFYFLKPLDFYKDGNGEIIQMDALFVRKNEYLK